jgi:hypothetical protein
MYTNTILKGHGSNGEAEEVCVLTMDAAKQ